MLEYFEGIFSSSNPSDLSSDGNVVLRKLSKDQQVRCATVFTVEEVKNSLFQMHPKKAPGPDGLNAGFF